MPDLDVVILAAGQGMRMRSGLPKVLHEIGGRPLLSHVIDVAEALSPTRVHVVHGHGGELVRERLADRAVRWVPQTEQLGTGHAVAQTLPGIGDGKVLVLFGDVPLILASTLERLIASGREVPLAVLTVVLDDPGGYGRIVRSDAGSVAAIVEERDASPAQRKIREINTGILVADSDSLKRWIGGLGNENAQGEYYLTDIVAAAVAENREVRSAEPGRPEEVLGVNDRAQLAVLERVFQRRAAEQLMLAGATLRDPARVDLRGRIRIEPDVSIDVNVVLEGDVHISSGVRIGPNNVIRDAVLGPDTEVLANCVIEGARTGRECRIGPFSRLRPGAELGDRVHIGNFVEVKKSSVGHGSKVNHLTYLGDSEVGSDVNVGAGTITCNYDGANKHRTTIEDGAFIGSGVELVAPVRVGAGATIGAGSTIGRDVPPGGLTLERGRQKTVEDWKRPTKQSSD